ncbi:MAG: chemotaxis protein CheD [Bacillota bacterium]
MKKTFSHKFDRPMVEVFPGEYHISNQNNIVLTTLLGSCVAVCMLDRYNQVAGINHIMISKSANTEKMLLNQDSRYGIHAMELLINGMLKKGAQRSSLRAKIFGGGKVLNLNDKGVGYANIDFAVSYLKNENIPILARDTGGEEGRKIYFFPNDFSVYLRRIGMKSYLQKTKEQEREYVSKYKEKNKNDNLTIFD